MTSLPPPSPKKLGLVIDLERESVVIRPKDGLGGIGGDYVLPTALANVREFTRRLPGRHVIGCGGIRSGREAFMHILAGATVVQVGTCLYEEGPACLARQHKSGPSGILRHIHIGAGGYELSELRHAAFLDRVDDHQ